jgi:hypothetical protein
MKRTANTGVEYLVHTSNLCHSIKERRSIAAHIPNHDLSLRELFRGYDSVCILHSEAHGLLDEDKFVVLQTQDGMCGMVFRRVYDKDYVDVWGSAELARIPSCLWDAANHFGFAVTQGFVGYIAEVGDLEVVGHEAQGGNMYYLTYLAATDHAHADNSIWGSHDFGVLFLSGGEIREEGLKDEMFGNESRNGC